MTQQSSTIQTTPKSTNYTSPKQSPYNLDLRRYIVSQDHQPLGKGAQSTVYLVIEKETNEKYALKQVHLNGFDDLSIPDFIKDINDLPQLIHANINRVYSMVHIKKDACIYILLEYIDGASLKDYLGITPQIPEIVLGRLILQVMRGMAYLKRNGFLHRDLKPSNIMISRKGEVKIADFGLAKHLKASLEQRITYIGAIPYMSPERLNNQPYSYPADIWSLGMIAYECALGKFPYPGDISSSNEFDVEEYFSQGIQVAPLPGYSDDFHNFLVSCFAVDPKNRATIEQLLDKSSWASQYADDKYDQIFKAWLQECETRRQDNIAACSHPP